MGAKSEGLAVPRVNLRHYLQARRRGVAVAILAAGFVAGLLVYVSAPPSSEDPLADQAYQSKQYQRQMEEYGGAVNELASGFREWFAGLWHGKTLGVTLFCLSALLAGAAYLALTPLPPRDD